MSDKKETHVKPLVHFNGDVRFNEHANAERSAVIYGVMDHPRLGMQHYVITSKVLHNEGKDLIETMNTIYKRI